MTSQNKFLDGSGGTDSGTGGISGGISVTDGGTDIYVNSVKIKTATPSENVKTNNQKILTTFPVEWVSLDDTNPQTITSTLEAVDFKTTTYPSYDAAITGIKQGSEFPKLASVPTPAAGTLRFYANTDDTFHQKDDSGVDKIIGNSGHVLGPNSVSADGKVAIYNGTTGKVLKDSNLLVDAQNHLDISGNFARYQGGVAYLNPPEVNSLAAVGYVQQERNASNGRITTLETKTARIGVLPGNTTFIETTDFLPDGEGIVFQSLKAPTVPMVHDINRVNNLFFNTSEEIFKRNVNLVSNSPAATNNVFTEKITAAGNIGGSSSAKDVNYEILTGAGTTVTTRLKIAANGHTEIYGDIRLFGNVRVGSAGFLELNFGSPSSTYIFPQSRPAAGQVLTGGIGDGLLNWASSTRPYIFQDQKSTGVGAGTSSPINTWNLRDLNTSLGNPGTDATLAANQITLQPGTYSISGSAPAYAVARHKIRLWNVTDGLAAITGTSEHCATGVQTRSFMRGEVVVLTPTVFQLEQWVNIERVDIGYGFYTGAADAPEVYSEISIWKII